MRRSGRVVASVPLLLVALFVTGVAAAVAVRAVQYPFWAAAASHDDLSHSWGGPSAVGATLVHWLVAVVTLAVCVAVLRALRSGWRRLWGGPSSV